MSDDFDKAFEKAKENTKEFRRILESSLDVDSTGNCIRCGRPVTFCKCGATCACENTKRERDALAKEVERHKKRITSADNTDGCGS